MLESIFSEKSAVESWNIMIFNAPPEECRQFNLQGCLDLFVLANWVVGEGGLDWINHLVAKDKAILLIDHGAPYRYLVKAKHVKRLKFKKNAWSKPSVGCDLDSKQNNGILGKEITGNMQNMRLDRQMLLSCDPDAYLTVDAWDWS